MNDGTWIWIVRWVDFQHYKPDRDRAPAWIKSYTKQLDDDRYLSLTLTQRGLLDSLRMAFARSHGRLPRDTRKLTRRLNERVTRGQLDVLCYAGYIEFLSREVLDQRLEKFYASRAPARTREGEKEKDIEPVPVPEPVVLPTAHGTTSNGAGAGAGDLSQLEPEAELERLRSEVPI